MQVPTLLPTVAEMDALALEVGEAVTVAAGAGVFRDSAAVARAVAESLERVAVELDMTEPYFDRLALPARVFSACVELGCCYLKRGGAAYGVVGLDDADPLARANEMVILRALVPGEKIGWGIG